MQGNFVKNKEILSSWEGNYFFGSGSTGGGGTFSTSTNIFSKFFACVDNFFKSVIPCSNFFLFQLIIFPIEKSLHEFFFSNFFGARIFFFLFRLLDFYFCSPHQFSNGPAPKGLHLRL